MYRSDCKALEWLKDKRPRGARINKWLLRLQEYDYKVVHRPGVKSANCDGLTRQPLPAEGSYDVDPFETLPAEQKVVHALTRAQRLKTTEGSSVFLRDALDEHPSEQPVELKDEPVTEVPLKKDSAVIPELQRRTRSCSETHSSHDVQTLGLFSHAWKKRKDGTK